MAPRGHTLPKAATESAREARKAFFCDLCQKGYARMNEFEAHENSYDHQHRKRLLDMRQLTKDPNAAARQREAENRANRESGITTLSTSQAGVGGPAIKKAPVFKSTLQAKNISAVTAKAAEADASDELDYDPGKPTEYRDFNVIKVSRSRDPPGPGEWDDSEDESAPRLKMVMY